jgi:hypothetical protein
MKIKELLKYIILPLFLVLFYSVSFFTENSDLSPNDSSLFFIILILALVILAILILLFLELFVFFKKSEVPIIIFSMAVLLNFFIKMLLISINTPVTISVSGDSDLITSVLLFYLAIGYFVYFIRNSFNTKDNRFLLFIIIFAGLVFTFDFIYFGLKLMDTGLKIRILMLAGIGLFLVFSFVLIFSLPNSDYMEWKKDHRQLFLKTILVPWVLILFLLFMNFIVSPDNNTSKEKTSTSPAFGMKDYEITLKDGME